MCLSFIGSLLLRVMDLIFSMVTGVVPGQVVVKKNQESDHVQDQVPVPSEPVLCG